MERNVVELDGLKYDCEIVRPDLEDINTWDLLKSSDTLGVFQVETPSFMGILPGYVVKDLPDLSAVIALYRPGPLQGGNFQDYIERKHGRQRVEYDHPKLEPVLRETYGIFVYQEQCIQASMALAGFSEAEGDNFRKAIGKMKPDILVKEEQHFIEGCIKNGTDRETAKKVFDKIAAFAGYGFNKAHSVSYAIVAYQMAWLKTNFFIEFMAATLNFEGQGPRMKKYIDNCKKHGVMMLPPDVNESIGGVTIGRTRDGREGIRIGLSKIKGVGEKAVETIEQNRPYSSFTEFLNKIEKKSVHSGCLRALIEAGSFDSMGYTRKSLIELMNCAVNHKYPKETLDAQLTRIFGLPIEAIERTREEIKKRFTEAKERITPTRVRQELEQVWSGYNDALVTKKRRELDITLTDEQVEQLLRGYTEEYSAPELAQKEISLLSLFISTHPLEYKQEALNRLSPISLERLEQVEEANNVTIVVAIESIEYNPDRGRYDIEISDLSGHGQATIWSKTEPNLQVGACVAMKVGKSRWGISVRNFVPI